MKTTIVVLPIYAALFAAVFVLLALLLGAYYWIEAAHALGDFGFEVLMPHFFEVLPSLVSISAVLSLFLMLLAFRKRTKIGFFPSLAAFLWASLLYGGLFLAATEVEPAGERRPLLSPYKPGYIYPIGDRLFYGERIDYASSEGSSSAEVKSGEGRLAVFTPLLLISPPSTGVDDAGNTGENESTSNYKPSSGSEAGEGGDSTGDPYILSFFERGVLDGEEKVLRLEGEVLSASDGAGSAEGSGAGATDKAGASDGASMHVPLESDEAGLFLSLDPPQLIEGIAEEAGIISHSLEKMHEKSVFFLAGAILLHVLFFVVSWSFIRTSRWPLFNALVGLLILRGFFFLHRVAGGDLVRTLLKAFSLGNYTEFAPSALLILLSLLLLLWNLAFYAGRKGGA